MRQEEMRGWMKKIIEKYWIDEKKLEELDKEIGACRRKEQFWDSYIKYLNSIDRSATSYDIEVILEWCEEEKKKLSEESKEVSKERAKRDLCESVIDFFKLNNKLNKEG
ncbi:unnamed protein product [marine sediment metagenome]|uniref:Uncharacterized protein n=1 Tax=marine sediment metagenome TaxID=412755 RepID=X1KFW2_9ZZZZ